MKRTDVNIDGMLKVWSDENPISRPVGAPERQKVLDEISRVFSIGPSFYYLVDFSALKMLYVSESINAVLGIKPEAYTVQGALERIHPEDLKMMEAKEATVLDFMFNKIAKEDILKYKVVYLNRYLHQDGQYRLLMHQARTLQLSKDDKIQITLCTETDVSHLGISIDHKVSFVGIGRPSFLANEPGSIEGITDRMEDIFSDREKKIITLTAEGKNAKVISDDLKISEQTVKTHRRNILRKSGAANMTALIAMCVREGWV